MLHVFGDLGLSSRWLWLAGASASLRTISDPETFAVAVSDGGFWTSNHSASKPQRCRDMVLTSSYHRDALCCDCHPAPSGLATSLPLENTGEFRGKCLVTENNLLVSCLDSSFLSCTVGVHPCLEGYPNAHVGPCRRDCSLAGVACAVFSCPYFSPSSHCCADGFLRPLNREFPF